jgi:hypothetical protein
MRTVFARGIYALQRFGELIIPQRMVLKSQVTKFVKM